MSNSLCKIEVVNVNCNEVLFYVEHFTYEDAVEELGRKAANEMWESYDACAEKKYKWLIVSLPGNEYLVKTRDKERLVEELQKHLPLPPWALLKRKGALEEAHRIEGDVESFIRKFILLELSPYLTTDLNALPDKNRGDARVSLKFSVPAMKLARIHGILHAEKIDLA